ncbi:tRNA (adenosine(37)-N6)-threonylcarbamoyltransferase complex transferase subunit TsaD [Flavobacteriaceae bacterium]|jgi:N6-L-threonylcarbamoyladenine synthase|nr:tRNA (adenosine(37)-N6)-threonylcarbamoyltransferase complex transferase subunit TsaD [Flavobacteriaceae bacterium]MDA9124352.1 tRNA (adenosine(37)-N6)-threonylcarbamoyltransferase complex transferase subunit TsaD [bacterium]MBT4313840.1 tRNA (adenosine(37)-N6)-threonylcarbamoyltransferase complex transferase subunit TsaD [Flavobacteriaceae bacterium]MBT5090800.1 tRNA (adenosine(37)-N6)-threonylcarbamoyltransferase complex transferase subunit TsaD [Flavobacteriaceae bacterium]MBT5284230.1 tR
MLHKTPIILAIESSCDDTAAAVIKGRKILSNCIANQEIHIAYGGVVPELASRAHQSKIVPVVQQALRKANIDKKDLTAIAYTQGPGLLGSLLVGSAFAKSIALALDIPLIPINHMQGHLLVHFIDDERIQTPAFPCLGVTVSGGHTQLVLMHDQFKMEILGTTLDDAIGEAFDKCGKRMGLPYPSGPQIDKLAKEGNPHRFTFPIPNLPGYDVSYSGVKTAVINFLSNQEQKDPNFIKLNRNDLCASIQYTLVQIILTKIVKVVKEKKLSHIIIGGGVAANSEIRTQLQNIALKEGWIVSLPPFEYTTDNAAMIGIAAYYKIQKEEFGGFGDPSNARLKYGL